MRCFVIIYYAPNFEEVAGAYWFRVVRPSVRASVHQNPSMLGFWNFIYGFLKTWKNSWRTFFFFFLFVCFVLFFLSELSPFLVLCPFEKIWMKSDACHILRSVHARVLKFHKWIRHGKIADPYFFSCPSYLPFWSYAPLKTSEWLLVSKISPNVFELGAWNLISW